MRLQYNKNAKNPVYSLLNQLTIISLKNVLIEFLKIQLISDDNYIPGFTKTDLTDALQEALGFALQTHMTLDQILKLLIKEKFKEFFLFRNKKKNCAKNKKNIYG